MPSKFDLGFRSLLSGEISPRILILETLRRTKAKATHRSERAAAGKWHQTPARLHSDFQALSLDTLLEHFRKRDSPSFFPGMQAVHETAELQQILFPQETMQLISAARTMAEKHRWSLLGFGEKEFGDSIDWLRDPLSGKQWPLQYHADIQLLSTDGSDVRVLWELNRLGHLISLGRAYAITRDAGLAEEVFVQLESWHAQNPVGLGPNWSCAMEVALRAMNLLAAFTLSRGSENLTEERLLLFLKVFDQHARHIKRNLEFSYLGNSNHYLSDLAGLLWIGLLLPELAGAREWTKFAQGELSRELEEQVLSDGADNEGSTGYHRYVLELFLYSFILCRANGIEVDDNYRDKLCLMLNYLLSYLRPCGSAPLVGDTDGGRVLPLAEHSADDHAYLLPIGAALLGEAAFKPAGQRISEDLLWLLGKEGITQYEKLIGSQEEVPSQAFPEAGTYVMRSNDAYLLFNSSTSKRLGRSSHRHNDALSIDLAACGRSFIVDPGTYVYTANQQERHLFRSTAFHSTIEIDGTNQNASDAAQPFVLGDQAQPRIVEWETGPARDIVVGEHIGYERLREPVRHRRSVTFYRKERWWLIEDDLAGKGEHMVAARFHFDSGLEISVTKEGFAAGYDQLSGARLLICPLDTKVAPIKEHQFTSRHYGAKNASITVCWSMRMRVPFKLRWALVPVCSTESEQERLGVVGNVWDAG